MESFQPTQTFVYQRAAEKRTADHLYWKSLEVVSAKCYGGTAATAPPPFRPGNPALCGSHPLVTPYYCRLGDLLYFVFIVSLLYFFLLIV